MSNDIPNSSTARMIWSIGIYAGHDPLVLSSPPGIRNPVITAAMVTDVPARAVADPFLLRRGDRFYLFFEVWNADTQRGEIAYATSTDGFHYTYGQVVLREPFHLSYPHVFEWSGRIYMIPETRKAGAIRLYEATTFPERWSFVRELARGRFADATVVRHNDRFYLFAQRGLDEMRLFHAADLDGPWAEHPCSPLWPGNRRITRPGGRMTTIDGRLHRFAQDGIPSYGCALRALCIDRLTPTEFEEHEAPGGPILAASHRGWNAVAMHHIDVQPAPSGGYLAAVDGATLGAY